MVNEFYNAIAQQKPEAPFIIIGTHADLEGSREVTKEEAESLASNLHCEYYETSPFTPDEVNTAFNSIISKTVHSILQNTSLNTPVDKKHHKKDRNTNHETCLI